MLIKAVAVFEQTKSSSISGVIYFEQNINGGYTTIYGNINGLKHGKHGIHIHAYGDKTSGCESAGPHYNPFNMDHGGPDDNVRHIGDLGNMLCEDENIPTFFMLKDTQISLIGPYSVIGRSLVIHADPDDLGKGKSTLSKTTGNSGARLGCAVIGIAQPN